MLKRSLQRTPLSKALLFSALVLFLLAFAILSQHSSRTFFLSAGKTRTIEPVKSLGTTTQQQQTPHVKTTRDHHSFDADDNSFGPDATDVLDIIWNDPHVSPKLKNFDGAILWDTVFRISRPRAPPPLSV